jgi:hypothetical protein
VINLYGQKKWNEIKEIKEKKIMKVNEKKINEVK